MKVVEYGTEGFKDEWLELVKEDPIHPSIPVEKRITGSRTLFVMVDENDVPQAVLCVKMGDRLPQSMRFVMGDQKSNDITKQSKYAILYSVFRLKQTTVKGAGSMIIKLVKAHYKAKSVKRFYTLSPITDLTQNFTSIPTKADITRHLLSGDGPVSKFHMGNGAEIHAIHYNADSSPQRIYESWGIMVNYDYSDYV